MRKKIISKKLSVLCSVFIIIAFIFTQSVIADSIEKFNMSYVYFGNSNSYKSTVDSTKGTLDDISPSYFDINTDGTLKFTPALDTNFINEMHNEGIKVTPFLSNHWNRQNGIEAIKNREYLSSQIADAIAAYNLDGVNVDIENLTENERDSYTDFVRLLRQKLPSGKSVSIAVAPSYYDSTIGWQASYDYAGLAQYCDYLMLMTYDQHYQGSDAGPIAAASFVENTIKYTLKKVPADKVVLGIAFYGRYWKQGDTYGGYGISTRKVDELVRNYRGVVTYDIASQSPKAVITIESGDVKPVISDRTLSAGKYTIWYENEQSIKYKLQLVNKYNLKGTGSWSLGQESNNTWDYYGLWLSGFYFSDVEGYWAQNDIISVANKGWMTGVSNTSFLPVASLTRAQAAVILVRALNLKELTDKPYESFSDITNHWARTEIEIAKQHNIINGIGNGQFGPELPVTREQIAAMLDRTLMLQDIDDTYNKFNDVASESSSWAYKSISKMAYYNIVNGYPDGLFHPDDSITRSQMAVLMERVSGYIDDMVLVASN